MPRREVMPPISGSPDIKVGLSPCRSDQESCDLGRKRLIHGFFWDLSLSSVSLPLSTAAYAGPALAGGPARRLPRVDVKCSIYGCYSMTDGLETPRKLCRFAELRPTLMSGDSYFGRTAVVYAVRIDGARHPWRNSRTGCPSNVPGNRPGHDFSRRIPAAVRIRPSPGPSSARTRSWTAGKNVRPVAPQREPASGGRAPVRNGPRGV